MRLSVRKEEPSRSRGRASQPMRFREDSKKSWRRSRSCGIYCGLKIGTIRAKGSVYTLRSAEIHEVGALQGAEILQILPTDYRGYLVAMATSPHLMLNRIFPFGLSSLVHTYPLEGEHTWLYVVRPLLPAISTLNR